MNKTVLRVLAMVLLSSGCFLKRSETTIEPERRPEQMRPMPISALPPRSDSAGNASEPNVDLEMVNAPVKLVLQKLADLGGLQLIIPPELNRTLSVQYIHIPVSVALADVLSRSGLRLGPATLPNQPFDTVTVFYRLPANVDSMSAEAIVRRFGVSPGVASLIVKARRPR